jgi:hypothetical protein
VRRAAPAEVPDEMKRNDAPAVCNRSGSARTPALAPSGEPASTRCGIEGVMRNKASAHEALLRPTLPAETVGQTTSSRRRSRQVFGLTGTRPSRSYCASLPSRCLIARQASANDAGRSQLPLRGSPGIDVGPKSIAAPGSHFSRPRARPAPSTNTT